MTHAHRKEVTLRVLRPGEPEPPDTDWLAMTMEERIDAVWELTRLCMQWNAGEEGEPRLQRSVVRIQRRGR